MKYTLMTGATGLLGAYVLRDNLAAGQRLALLVRSSRLESARQRVESILARFEKESERPLSRPVVLEGDLTKPAGGLDADALRWVAKNCDRVLHNAASLSFYHDEKTGEPYRSNVEGTKNTLQLCRETGTRQFHHVSTAYICGLRSGTCLESELDMGQRFGNDYERTKVEAEQLVRAADFIDPPTFYRPSIIVGDSKTGYTSSYHGFYTPLKIAQGVIGNSSIPTIDGLPILSALGLSGGEQKNFVPVDWVSAAMTHVLSQPDRWGQTYHLVPRNRVTVKTATRVLEDALRRFHPSEDVVRSTAVKEWSFSPELFREQMLTYRAYWRNDPVFDYRNTTAAAPHLPCPIVHYAMLMRMALFALGSAFGWPRPQPMVPACDVAEKLAPLLSRNSAAGGNGALSLGLQINGRGGGQWTLFMEGDTVSAARCGLPTDDRILVYLSSDTVVRLSERTTSVSQVLSSGAVHAEQQGGRYELNQQLVENV
ncbi:MAG: SDR family oxidoreductase, partial [Pirellulales bacterium]